MEKGTNALANAISNLGEAPTQPGIAVRTSAIFDALDKGVVCEVNAQRVVGASSSWCSSNSRAVYQFIRPMQFRAPQVQRKLPSSTGNL